MCPFSFRNSTDTFHQTHSPSVAVLEMTDEGRAKNMDPSPILGGLGCSEKSGVFGTSFAVCWRLGAYNTSSVLGRQHRSGEWASTQCCSQYSMSPTPRLCRFHRSSPPWLLLLGPQHNLVQNSARRQLKNNSLTGVNGEVTRGTFDYLALWSDALAKRAHQPGRGYGTICHTLPLQRRSR